MNEVKYLTPAEKLSANLISARGLHTQFTPGANIPNDKNLIELDPANYFENSNKTHFYGFSDNTYQPERYYHGEYTPARVVSYEPKEGAFFIDPSNDERYFFISERAGYGTENFDGSRVPKLFKFQGLTFEDQISLQIPQLKPLTVGANNYVFSETDDYLGFVSSNTDTGNGLGGDLLLLEVINGQIIDRTGDLPPTLSAELYGYSNAVNVHGMGVGDLTGNGRSDIILGDIDVGIYSILQADDGSWSIYQPDVFSLFMYETDRDNLEENFEYRVTQIELIDINNDGWDDIFISFGTPGNISNPAPPKPDVIYINQGEGVFSIEDKIELSLPSYGLDLFETIDAEVIDINEDGFDDLFLFSTKNEPHYSGFQVQIQINKDGTGFEDQTIDRFNLLRDRSISEKWNDYSYNFQYLDLNDDGHLDILNFDRNHLDSAPNDDLGKLQVFLNDGEGYFTEVYVQEHWASENAEKPYSTNQPFQIIAANDFDDNGTIDFVTWHKSLTGGLDAEVVWYALSSFVDPIYTGPNQIDVASIAPGYNELFYLRSNPDVKAFVEQETYQTGLHHYLEVGKSEEREIFAPNTKIKTGDGGWDITMSYGNETAIGGEGNDKIYGMNGNDNLVGGIGDDILDGGDGDDTLTGNGGSDIFVFKGDFGHDKITDYASDVDQLTFKAIDGAELNILALVETEDTYGNRVLSTSDGSSSVTLKAKIIVGTMDNDIFEFTKKGLGGHGPVVIRNYDSLEDKLLLKSYTYSAITKTLDASGHYKILFTEDEDFSTVTLKTSEIASSLKVKNLVSKTLKISDDDLNVNELGEFTLTGAKAIRSVKVEGISSFKSNIGKQGDNDASDPINLSDVLAQLKHIIGLRELKANALQAGDTNNDGEVNLSDVLENLKHIIGLREIDTFDLVTDNGFAVNALDADSNGNLTLVINGDANQSHADWGFV